jgi:hypothetical protein
MIQPDEQVIQGLFHISQNVPSVRDWLIRCADTELNRLPQTVNNTAVAQGRCQVLQELKGFLEKSPETAAQARGASRAQPRTPIGA